MSIAKNLDSIRNKIDSFQKGPSKNKIKLIAVSKRQSIDKMLEAVKAGQLDFGENYVQEARQKRSLLPKEARIHMIGPLQKNKIKYCPQTFCSIHSVHQLDVAKALQKKYEASEGSIDILIQMNLHRESTKSGLYDYDALIKFVEEIEPFKRLNLRGLMTIPDFNLGRLQTGLVYGKMRDYLNKLKKTYANRYDISELSMGMSADYEIAITEGATMIRVGTAIFGERD